MLPENLQNPRPLGARVSYGDAFGYGGLDRGRPKWLARLERGDDRLSLHALTAHQSGHSVNHPHLLHFIKSSIGGDKDLSHGHGGKEEIRDRPQSFGHLVSNGLLSFMFERISGGPAVKRQSFFHTLVHRTNQVIVFPLKDAEL